MGIPLTLSHLTDHPELRIVGARCGEVHNALAMVSTAYAAFIEGTHLTCYQLIWPQLRIPYLGTLSRRSGRSSCIAPACCNTSMFCRKVALSQRCNASTGVSRSHKFLDEARCRSQGSSPASASPYLPRQIQTLLFLSETVQMWTILRACSLRWCRTECRRGRIVAKIGRVNCAVYCVDFVLPCIFRICSMNTHGWCFCAFKAVPVPWIHGYLPVTVRVREWSFSRNMSEKNTFFEIPSPLKLVNMRPPHWAWSKVDIRFS